jgi:hypothetical protein
MSRENTISGLVLTLLLVLAYLALGILLKFSGYPDYPFLRWNPIAVGLRTYGLWSLILPILLVVCAAFAEDEDRWFTAARIGLALVVIAIVMVAFLYFLAFLNPYTQPLLRMVDPSYPAK